MTPKEWELGVLKDYIREPIRNGYSPVCPSLPTGKWILSLAAVTPSGFNPKGVKPAPLNDRRVDEASLQEGDLIVSRSNTRGRVGLAGLYEGIPFNCFYPDLLMRIRCNNKIDPRYLCFALLSDNGRTYFERVARGTSSSMVKIDRALLEEFPVLCPPIKEQRKIAAILSSVEDAVQTSQAVIDHLHVVKKTMMAELLTRGLPGRHSRFKQTEMGEIPVAWAVLPLGDALHGIDAGWSPQCLSSSASQGEWGVLKVSAVTSGQYLSSENKALPPSLSPRPDLEVKPNDIVLARANGVLELVGKSVLIRSTPPRLMLSDKLLRLRPKADLVLGSFLNLVLQSESVRSRLLATTGGSHMRNISQQALRELQIALPTLDEQSMIANAIVALDVFLEQLVDEQVARNSLKTTLLSALLTGELRVTPDPEPAP